MKLESKVFRDAANIYLWDGIKPIILPESVFSCCAIEKAYFNNFHNKYSLPIDYKRFYRKHFKPRSSGTIWWKVGWRFWTQAAVQRHRKKMLLKAADLVDKMNGESL